MNRSAPPATFSASDLPELCEIVASTDPDLRGVIERHGYPPFWSRPNTFESLVWYILEQQVSLASAKAALEKLRERIGLITPDRVLTLSDEDLRAAYFSRQKTAYVRGLAHHILDGHLDLTALETMADDEIRSRLVALKGVGNWTVDVYLIITLHRVDLFPAGDVAVVNGLKHLKQLPRETPIEQVRAVAAVWAPHRTIGTMLVWHDYLARRSTKHTAAPVSVENNGMRIGARSGVGDAPRRTRRSG